MKNFPIYAEEDRGYSWTRMSNIAKINNIYLIAGTMPEKDSENHIYNTSYVFNRDGEQIAKHRKMHLFDINIKGGQTFKESDMFTAGNSITIFNTEFCTMGVEICYDIKFPELTYLTEEAGAKIIFVPAIFNMTTGPLHWELLFRTRSVDNQIYMVGCSQARRFDYEYVSYANSIITSPWGDIVNKMDEKEKIIVQEIDLSYVEKIREQLPLLKQKRKDIYSLSLL